MRKTYFYVALISLASLGFKAAAQEYDVPKHYAFKSNEDYKTYEPQIVKAIDWLEKTPWTEQVRKRDEAKAFVLKWIDGSPVVTITYNSELVHLAKDNPELLGSYMYGYTKYSIQHQSDFDDTKAKLAGVKALITKYTNQPDHKPNPEVEKVIAVNNNGKLEAWIRTDFNTR